ncbi:hypothetical protein QBC47DRAFT_356052 [Echria macrotheca]|uniref:DUF6590 domain-containing protein n=1 Tax=Echria macrotheca TaxID=438768 RepID=A0AAJ0BMX3_9PEZI|nr:hypothetical protein QBC47DRAFT_356052 [Echria macrotheca]
MSNNTGWADGTQTWEGTQDDNGQYYHQGYYDGTDPAAPRADEAGQAGQVAELTDAFGNQSLEEQQYGYGGGGGYAYSGAYVAQGAAAYVPAQASSVYGHGYPPAHQQTQQPPSSSLNKKGKGVESGKPQKKSTQGSKSAPSKKPQGRSKAHKAAAAHNQPSAADDNDEDDLQEQGGASQFAADGSGFAPQPTASPEPVDTDYTDPHPSYPTTTDGQPTYGQESYPPQDYPPSHPQQGYAQQGYSQMYPQQEYPQQGYSQPGYAQSGFSKSKQAYPPQGPSQKKSTYVPPKKSKPSKPPGKSKDGQRRERDRPPAEYRESNATELPPGDYDQDNDDGDGGDDDRTPTPTPGSMRGGSTFGSSAASAAGYGTGEQDSDFGYGTGQLGDSLEEEDIGYSAGQPDMQSHAAASSHPVYPANASVYHQGPSIGYQIAPGYLSQSPYGGGYNNPDHAVYSFQASTSGLYSTGDLNPEDRLDGRYQIHKSNKFMPGEVFKALWPEPLGSAAVGPKSTTSQTEVPPTEFTEQRKSLGQNIYVGFRRFIVVANDEGHCTCVPILTYERRACTKNGVKPSKHGIVYQVGGRAQTVKNEPQLGYPPIRLELYVSTEKLAKESRVNYSKLCTVEHNIQVFFIGRIVRQDFDIVQGAVNDCWEAKARSAGERSYKHRRK